MQIGFLGHYQNLLIKAVIIIYINSCNIIFNKINIDSSDNVTEKFNFSNGQKDFMIKPSKVTESINNLLNSWQNFPVFLFNLDPFYGDKDHVKK